MVFCRQDDRILRAGLRVYNGIVDEIRHLLAAKTSLPGSTAESIQAIHDRVYVSSAEDSNRFRTPDRDCSGTICSFHPEKDPRLLMMLKHHFQYAKDGAPNR